MIDPANVTQYDQTDAELEQALLFWMLVAGKPARQMAQKLETLLVLLTEESGQRVEKPRRPRRSLYDPSIDPSPFALLAWAIERDTLDDYLRAVRVGKYTLLGEGFRDVVREIDPRTCTLEELEAVPGIGPKTARCFLIHSRPNQRYAGLDTHILKWLASRGYIVPKSTPTGKTYRMLEELFLAYADRYGLAPADLDLRIWRHYSEGAELVLPEPFVLPA
jgi:hypothetical protein